MSWVLFRKQCPSKPGKVLNRFQWSIIEVEGNYMASDSPRRVQGWLPAVSIPV